MYAILRLLTSHGNLHRMRVVRKKWIFSVMLFPRDLMFITLERKRPEEAQAMQMYANVQWLACKLEGQQAALWQNNFTTSYCSFSR